MSHIASIFCGSALAAIGICDVLDLITTPRMFLKRDIQIGSCDGSESTCKKMGRLFANALKFLGAFALAVGIFSLGAALITIGPELGFLIGFQEALGLSLPYLATAFGGLFAGEGIQRLSQ